MINLINFINFYFFDYLLFQFQVFLIVRLNKLLPSSVPALFIKIIAGVMITGGWNGGSLVITELFLPATGKTCSLESLPTARWRHTLDQLGDGTILACGGWPTETRCDKFTPSLPYGTWSQYSSLIFRRVDHTSLAGQHELLLMGGRDSEITTELASGGQQYNLTQNTM